MTHIQLDHMINDWYQLNQQIHNLVGQLDDTHPDSDEYTITQRHITSAIQSLHMMTPALIGGMAEVLPHTIMAGMIEQVEDLRGNTSQLRLCYQAYVSFQETMQNLANNARERAQQMRKGN